MFLELNFYHQERNQLLDNRNRNVTNRPQKPKPRDFRVIKIAGKNLMADITYIYNDIEHAIQKGMI